ncbi:MAG: alpha/beta hydrolase [Erysipelotrichaceae bacterium]|nr:alpha/beta hydrolase [Erysipelotrichaceae bacterium]
MSFGKYLTFYRNKLLFSNALRKYKKEHPESSGPSFKLSKDELEKMCAQLIEQQKKTDTDCLKLDPKKVQDLDIKRVDLRNCRAWKVSKKGNRKDKIIYYIHGGGFTSCSTKRYFDFVSYVVNHFGYDVFSIDYRLAPEYKCLDILDDCLSGYEELLKEYEGEDICLMGESAGATLTLTLTLKLKELDLPLPKGNVSCSPLSQFEYYPYSYYENAGKNDFLIGFGTLDNIYPIYRGQLDYTSPYMSPLYGDLSDFPKIYLDASYHECMRDDARALYGKLKMLGNDVEYHELRYFSHAELVNTGHRYVRKEEYPLIRRFLDRLFG